MFLNSLGHEQYQDRNQDQLCKTMPNTQDDIKKLELTLSLMNKFRKIYTHDFDYLLGLRYTKKKIICLTKNLLD